MLTKNTSQNTECPLSRLLIISENHEQLAQWLSEKQSEELRQKYNPLLERYKEAIAQLREEPQRAY